MTVKSRRDADLKLVELLAAGTTQAEAARLCGISPRTVARRLEKPEFVQSVDAFRGRMLETASGRLAGLIDDALDGLRDLLTADSPPAIKLAAAKCVMEQCLRFRELVSIDRRISTLESAAQTRTDDESWDCYSE